MKSLIAFSLIFLSHFVAATESFHFKLEEVKIANSRRVAEYTLEVRGTPTCVKSNDCYILISDFEHSYSITFNTVEITNLKGIFQKYSNLFVPIPGYLWNKNNIIRLKIISVYDINGRPPRNFLKAKVNSYSEILIYHWKGWLLKTGLTLFSAYTLALLFILFLLLAIVDFDFEILALSVYSLVAFVYLVSFSELPRSFINPALLGGAVHFSLRLLQDCFLFLLFYNFYKHKNKKVLIIFLSLYMVPISIMIISFLYGRYEYSSHLDVIRYSAPLVAFPMGYSFVRSFYIPRGKVQRTLLGASFLLFMFQLNDLFVFWNLIDGYYTVKFYIPLVVILLFYLYLIGRIRNYKDRQIFSAQSKIAIQLAHDIRSPISAIESVMSAVEMSNDLREIFDLSFSRVRSIANSILPHNLTLKKEVLFKIINELAPMKRLEFPDLVLELIIEQKDKDKFIICKKVEVERVLSNLINNSVEAGASLIEILIKLCEQNQTTMVVSIIDNGKGIPKEVINNIGLEFITFEKKYGTGVGLVSMLEMLNSCNGSYDISTSEKGTRIELRFKLS